MLLANSKVKLVLSLSTSYCEREKLNSPTALILVLPQKRVYQFSFPVRVSREDAFRSIFLLKPNADRIQQGKASSFLPFSLSSREYRFLNE